TVAVAPAGATAQAPAAAEPPAAEPGAELAAPELTGAEAGAEGDGEALPPQAAKAIDATMPTRMMLKRRMAVDLRLSTDGGAGPSSGRCQPYVGRHASGSGGYRSKRCLPAAIRLDPAHRDVRFRLAPRA